GPLRRPLAAPGPCGLAPAPGGLDVGGEGWRGACRGRAADRGPRLRAGAARVRALVPLLLALAAPDLGGEGNAVRARRAEALLARPELKRAAVSIEVRRLRDGAILSSHDPGRYVAPASSHKLVVSAAILDVLGPDARLRTTVEA